MAQFSAMAEWFLFLRGVAAGLLIAVMLCSILRFRRYYAMQMMALFALCILGYVLAPLLYGRSQWFFAVGFLADAIPLVFLLFAQALFSDHRSPAHTSLLLGGVYLGLGYAGLFLPDFLAVEATGMSALRLVSRLIMPLVVVFGLYLTLRHWQQDLVEPRRMLRLTIMVTVGAYIVGVSVIETLLLDQEIPAWVDVAHSAGIVASTLLFIGVIIAIGPAGLAAASEPARAAPPPHARDVEDPEVARILTAMEGDRSYRDLGLTIRSLGEQLAIPEHRLREHINKHLGYRNFNDFLNYYRLAEVRRRLADPECRHIPILTIAMDAGYRSMTTFNRAFKASFGVTPRKYRDRH